MAQVEFNVPGPGTYLIDADPSLPPLPNPGQASDVLTGEQFYDKEGNLVTGTMPNNPAQAVVIPGGGSYTIPQGYHTGQGTVTSSGSVLPTLTDPADAGEIVSGKRAIDQNGSVLTGTMPSNPAISETLEAGESYQVPAGYTPGGTVQAATLASQTPGTATQDDIIQGQTAWVNGVQITGALEPGASTEDATATAADVLEGETAYVATGKVSGTMPNNGAVQETLEAGGSYTIPAGYHNGQGTVTAESLEDQTAGTATAPDILSGKTAWVNGAQVTGSMPDNGAVTKEMTAGETYTIPAGYHNGSGTVTAPTVASETPGTAVAGDIRQGKTAWVDGEQLTGTVPDVEAATPTISVSPAGLITAETQQEAGYVAQATKAASSQLQTQGAQTITPGATQQTINGGVYLTGTQTILGDAGLVPDNIRNGITIFGITGSYEGDTGGEFAVPLTITVDSGVTVTAQNGDTTLTAVSNGTAQFILPKGGTWTITATKDGETALTTVTVQESYTGELEFIAGEVLYYGTATSIMQATNIAGTNVGDYALFAGGLPEGNHIYDSLSTVYVFNSSLTRSTATRLPENRKGAKGANFANRAIIMAGNAYNGQTIDYQPSTVSYDASLTQSILSPLYGSVSDNTGRSYFPAQAGGILLICSGNTFREYFDSSLTIHDISLTMSISSINGGGAGISLASYAIYHNELQVAAIDGSLTESVLDSLSVQRNYAGTAQNGIYALFAGGYYSSPSFTQYATVDAYDYSLTHTLAPDLASANYYISGGRLGDFAVFAGGRSNYTDVYDTSLTRESKDPLSAGQQYDYMAVANTGNYLLFGGGNLGSGNYSSTVDVYQLNISS